MSSSRTLEQRTSRSSTSSAHTGKSITITNLGTSLVDYDMEGILHYTTDKDSLIVSYGLPYPEACAKHIGPTLGCRRVYLLLSGYMSRHTNALDRLERALGKDVLVGVTKGMTPHTPMDEVVQTAEAVSSTKADCILCVGGGTLIDAAKLIAFAVANNVRSVEDLETSMAESARFLHAEDALSDFKDKFTPSAIKLACVTTTLSGGEYTKIAGGTNSKTKAKKLAYDPTGGYRLVIWDAELVKATPMRLWLSTGIRALDHCVESIYARTSSQEAKESSFKGLKHLVPALLTTKHDPDDFEARIEAQKGGFESLKALSLYKSNTCGSHGIGHQLGPFGVPHGETSCVILPSVVRYNKDVIKQAASEILELFWKDGTVADVLRKHKLQRSDCQLADALDAILAELEMPRTLKDVNIHREDFEDIAKNSLQDSCCKNNPIPLTKKEQILEILDMAAGDQ